MERKKERPMVIKLKVSGKRTLNENFSKNWEVVSSLISQWNYQTKIIVTDKSFFYGSFSTQKPKSDDNIKKFKIHFYFFNHHRHSLQLQYMLFKRKIASKYKRKARELGNDVSQCRISFRYTGWDLAGT